MLTGFRLSEIPEELTIKPVESIDGNQIEIKDDIRLSSFANGSASASVEVMLRRKYWDADVGFSLYIEAYRQAVLQRDDAEELISGRRRLIFLHYEITISEDLEIQEAITRSKALLLPLKNEPTNWPTEDRTRLQVCLIAGVSTRTWLTLGNIRKMVL